MGNKLLVFARLQSSWESFAIYRLRISIIVLEQTNNSTMKKVQHLNCAFQKWITTFSSERWANELRKQLRLQSTWLFPFKSPKHQNCPSTSFPQPIRLMRAAREHPISCNSLFVAHLKASQKLRFSDSFIARKIASLFADDEQFGFISGRMYQCTKWSRLRKMMMLSKEISYLN